MKLFFLHNKERAQRNFRAPGKPYPAPLSFCIVRQVHQDTPQASRQFSIFRRLPAADPQTADAFPVPIEKRDASFQRCESGIAEIGNRKPLPQKPFMEILCGAFHAQGRVGFALCYRDCPFRRTVHTEQGGEPSAAIDNGKTYRGASAGLRTSRGECPRKKTCPSPARRFPSGRRAFGMTPSGPTFRISVSLPAGGVPPPGKAFGRHALLRHKSRFYGKEGGCGGKAEPPIRKKASQRMPSVLIPVVFKRDDNVHVLLDPVLDPLVGRLPL